MSRPVQPSSRGRTTIASEPSGAKIVTVCGAIVSKRYYETFRLNGYPGAAGLSCSGTARAISFAVGLSESHHHRSHITDLTSQILHHRS